MADRSDTNLAFSSLRRRLGDLPGVGNEAAFARSALKVLEENWPLTAGEAGARAFSPGERAALQAVGVDEDEDAVSDALLRPVANHALLAATALPLAAAAERLGVDPSRLRQRLRERSIIGVRLSDGRSWGIPRFQLTEDGELPGLKEIVRATRPDIRPVQMLAFFTTAQADLPDRNGVALTPRDWLLAGGDPVRVADLARHL